ncbi:hypothetical protein CONLIGDRAFT_191369 [Coniochaeta ligniaria NRRL 30616]|uniref:Uncharacterized protein n=1 Tax=Coniochaeta ligniaria NRRL 30616 TaxID=1408157 RepID=A0A1J7K0X4_9PEZI|nr:hypothetical protein CONLIGDRAFT_191369 [Coniochaeta ligniaria NRRL 30616]
MWRTAVLSRELLILRRHTSLSTEDKKACVRGEVATKGSPTRQRPRSCFREALSPSGSRLQDKARVKTGSQTRDRSAGRRTRSALSTQGETERQLQSATVRVYESAAVGDADTDGNGDRNRNNGTKGVKVKKQKQKKLNTILAQVSLRDTSLPVTFTVF